MGHHSPLEADLLQKFFVVTEKTAASLLIADAAICIRI